MAHVKFNFTKRGESGGLFLPSIQLPTRADPLATVTRKLAERDADVPWLLPTILLTFRYSPTRADPSVEYEECETCAGPLEDFFVDFSRPV